jgi:LysR family transcriptional regulator, low CO2-responsive transcriptional regulator
VSINPAQLRAFHAVASEGSFTRAARALNVTQPTLSAQVKGLEERYGVRLFDRRGRGVALTGLGEALLAVTRRLKAVEEEAEQMLAAARGLRTGTLRVGADAPYSIVPSLGAFSRRHPGIKLQLSIGNSNKVLTDLLEHRCDVALLADVAYDPRLFATPILEDRLLAFVAGTHPWAARGTVALSELVGERIVLREPGSSTRRLFETALGRRGIALREVMEIGSREAVREAVAAGLGVGIVAASELGHDDRIAPVEIADARLDTVEYLVCLEERRNLRIVRAFFEAVRTVNPVSAGARPGSAD